MGTGQIWGTTGRESWLVPVAGVRMEACGWLQGLVMETGLVLRGSKLGLQMNPARDQLGPNAVNFFDFFFCHFVALSKPGIMYYCSSRLTISDPVFREGRSYSA